MDPKENFQDEGLIFIFYFRLRKMFNLFSLIHFKTGKINEQTDIDVFRKYSRTINN